MVAVTDWRVQFFWRDDVPSTYAAPRCDASEFDEAALAGTNSISRWLTIVSGLWADSSISRFRNHRCWKRVDTHFTTLLLCSRKMFSIRWEEVPCSNCKDQTSTVYARLSIMHYICIKPMPLHLEAQPRNRDVKRKTPCTHVSLLILPELTNRDSKLNDEERTPI